MYTNLQNAYENGKCPDCGEPISKDAENGDECPNCGHVFYEDCESDDSDQNLIEQK